MSTSTVPDYPEGLSYREYVEVLKSHYNEAPCAVEDSFFGVDRLRRVPLVQILDVRTNHTITGTFPNRSLEEYLDLRDRDREALATEALTTPPADNVRTRIIWIRYLGAVRPERWVFDPYMLRPQNRDTQDEHWESERSPERLHYGLGPIATTLGDYYHLDPLFFEVNFRTGNVSPPYGNTRLSYPRQPLPSLQRRMMHVETVDHMLSAAFIPAHTRNDWLLPSTGKLVFPFLVVQAGALKARVNCCDIYGFQCELLLVVTCGNRLVIGR